MSDSTDDPMAAAMVWVSRIFAISAEMVVPGLVADWLGKRWGLPWLAVPGFVCGIALGMFHLILFTRASERARANRKKAGPADDQ